MILDTIPDELKDLKTFKNILISKRIIFKKITTMQGKGNLQKLRVVFGISP